MDSKETFWYGLLVNYTTTIEQAQAKLEQNMREAHEQGLSLRWIAQTTGRSHETVRRIIKSPAS
jgi:IS30 family transposase